MYHGSADFRILFATSFSDACFRTARAIAQLADTCRVSVTIVHIAKRGGVNAAVRRELESFMAEADHYDDCRRFLIESDDAIDAIAELCQGNSFDLVVAPASDRLGIHSFFTRSFRTRLMRQCEVPLWTAGECIDFGDFKGNIRTVACVVDFEAESNTCLRLAGAFAARFGARLRILSVLPRVSEAMLAQSLHSTAPLMPEVAAELLRKACGGVACPDVDVAIGDADDMLPGMLRRSEANLVFMGPGQALRRTWLPEGASHLDRLPCPVICVDGASAAFRAWSFERTEAQGRAGLVRADEFALQI